MTYSSKEQQEAIVARYLNSKLTLREFSEKEGLPKSTLYTWSRKFNVNDTSVMKKSSLSAEQCFTIVLETATLTETQLSEYCRNKGLYPEQTRHWKQACIEANSPSNKTVPKANPRDKKRIKELEKELHRKEKALAETAALLVLRKKFNALYGLEEEQ